MLSTSTVVVVSLPSALWRVTLTASALATGRKPPVRVITRDGQEAAGARDKIHDAQVCRLVRERKIAGSADRPEDRSLPECHAHEGHADHRVLEEFALAVEPLQRPLGLAQRLPRELDLVEKRQPELARGIQLLGGIQLLAVDMDGDDIARPETVGGVDAARRAGRRRVRCMRRHSRRDDGCEKQEVGRFHGQKVYVAKRRATFRV
jgi:hypothetical protein